MKNTQIYFLNQIKSLDSVGQKKISLKINLKNINILKLLYNEGFIQSFFIKDHEILVLFRNIYSKSFFSFLKIISKTSFKKILKYKELCKLNSNLNLIVFSTDLGLLSLEQCKKEKRGGKILFML